MAFVPDSALRCPLDGNPLFLNTGGLRCEANHRFDLAREGYVNLLPSHQKRSRSPGDSRDMVAARRAFLEKGFYQPLVDVITPLVVPRLTQQALLVDAGCGEGYYLACLRREIERAGNTLPRMMGLDISKWAIKTAARRFSATWLVSSNRAIPVEDECADIVLDMFGFPVADEFKRILKPGGLWLRVSAGSGHLASLRRLIYEDVRERSVVQETPKGFAAMASSELNFQLPGVCGPDLDNLFRMTPHFYRASETARQRVAKKESTTIEVGIVIDCLENR